nr:GlsB/YeaQ/YmgE family stress response membrane protein [uncultured Flavobacterium sp.]
MEIVWTLIIGAVAGWLGSQIFRGGSLGLIGNIIVGILGSFVGYWLLGSVLNVSLGGGIIGSILTGAIGAIVILAILNLIFKSTRT